MDKNSGEKICFTKEKDQSVKKENKVQSCKIANKDQSVKTDFVQFASNQAKKAGKTDEDFVRLAIKQAKKAVMYGDVPVGALVVKNGEIVSQAYNRRERDSDATAHAETLAIQKACKKLQRWNLSDCELYVTLEPCAMCAGAIINSRISRVIFGAFDPRFGCGGSLLNLLNDSGLNHNAQITSGILQPECSKLLSDFFANLRKK